MAFHRLATPLTAGLWRPVPLALAAALLVGCMAASQPAPLPPATAVVAPAPAEPPTAGPATTPLRPAEQDPPALQLLPRSGTYQMFQCPGSPSVREDWLRDGGRLIGLSSAEPAVTWFITEQGVWRRDPKGPGLLRYLPPEPRYGLAWKQQSGDAEVWFLLRQRPRCEGLREWKLGPCWELYVLNRMELTAFHFRARPSSPPGPEGSDNESGILQVVSDDLRDPAAFGILSRAFARLGQPAPSRESILSAGAPWPGELAPEVVEVTPAEFAAARETMLAAVGEPVLEVDLDGDGRAETIQGRLGTWHRAVLRVRDDDGLPVWSFDQWLGEGMARRLDVVAVPGFDAPMLVYQAGFPERRHSIQFIGLAQDLSPALLCASLLYSCGWHSKYVPSAYATDYAVEADGTVVMIEGPPDTGGYTIATRYRLQKTEDDILCGYQAARLGQTVTPGPYPTTPVDLMTAVFLARFYGLDADLARYIPDAETRAAFQAQELSMGYGPNPVQVGKLTFVHPPCSTEGAQADFTIPRLEPAPPDPDGTADFLVSVRQYEGYRYYSGRVTFGREADGRLIVREYVAGKSGTVF